MTNRTMLLAGAALALMTSAALAQEPTTLTGCLRAGGTLVKLAIGDAPSAPCAGNQTQVTLQLGGGAGLNEAPFFAEAELDQTVDVLTHGPLTLFLGCRATFAFLGIRTSVDRTLIASHSPHSFGPSGAGEVAVLIGQLEPTHTSGQYVGTASESAHEARGIGQYTGSGASAITPDGFVLTVPADAVGWGIQVHSHQDTPGTPWENAPDCFVHGVAFLRQAPVLP